MNEVCFLCLKEAEELVSVYAYNLCQPCCKQCQHAYISGARNIEAEVLINVKDLLKINGVSKDIIDLIK